MKKIANKFIVLFFILAAVFAFAACDLGFRSDWAHIIYTVGNGTPAHKHSFGEWAITILPTAVKDGEETRSCQCGEMEIRPVPMTEFTVINSSSIADFAYLNRNDLKNIIIADSVISIGNYAFQNCSGLRIVIIGSGVKTIGNNPFYAASHIESITVKSDNTKFKSETNCLIRISDNVLITGCKNSVIPRGVTMLDVFSFSHIYDLETIIIPITVVKMGINVFNVCDKLNIYAEAEREPEGWGYSWNPRNRPVAWGYKGESFNGIVFEEPVIDNAYVRIRYDIKNAACEEILIKYYDLYQTEQICEKTLAYGTILAFGKWAWPNGSLDTIISIGRERGGFGIGIDTLEISPQTLETISVYWALIKPVISGFLQSDTFSTKIYSQGYSGGYGALDYYIDKMIAGTKDGKMELMDSINYINAVFAASYGKSKDNSGPKLSAELTF